MIDLRYLVTFANLQVILSQAPPNVPIICQSPPPYHNKGPLPNCCKIEPIFSAMDSVKCGISINSTQWQKKRLTHKDCSKFECLAKKYKLMKGNAKGEMDVSMLNAFLNFYAKRHPDFKQAVTKVKKKCVGRRLIGMESCPPYKVFSCIATYLYYVGYKICILDSVVK